MSRPVLIVTAAYPPENLIGVLRPWRFARYLPRFGYQPLVITASPGAAAQSGVFEAPFHFGLVERLLIKTVFPNYDQLTWMPAALAAARRLVTPASRPIVLSTSPPVSTHWVAFRLKKLFGLPWVADFRDPLVGNFSRGQTRLSLAADRFVERRIAQGADRIIFNTPSAAEAFRARYPRIDPSVSHLYNGFDPEEELGPAPAPPREYKLWLHCGSLYLNRYPERLFAALDRLVSSGRLAPRFRVRMIGDIGDRSLFQFLPIQRLRALDLLDCHPDPVPRSQALRELSEADGSIVFDHYHAAGVNLAIPAKSFESIRVGRPMLVFTSRGAPLHALMNDCGIPSICVFDDEEPAQIEQKVLAYTALPSTASPPSETFVRQFSAVGQTRQLAAWLDQL